MRAYRLQLALIGVLAIVVTATGFAPAQSNKNSPYNHHDSAEYRELDAVSRTQLDQVVKDFATLEEAFKGYMDDHDGQPPESLGDLAPKYVKALPKDPFAAPDGSVSPIADGASGDAAKGQLRDKWKHWKPSLGGAGYLYQRRPGAAQVTSWKPTIKWHTLEGSWRIRSVGLPNYPLRFASKNGRGLIRSHGYWGRMIIDVF